jgi:AraC family transcriptional regulator
MAPPIIARGSLGGRTIHRCHSAGFIFTETRHRPLMALPRHANDRATLIAVLRGAYAETILGRTTTHSPGTLIVRPPNEVHSNAFGQRGAGCLLVELTAARFQTIQDETGLFDRPRTFEPGLASPPAFRAAGELAQLDAVSPLVLEGLALEMIALAVRRATGPAPGRPAHPWLERVREALHAWGAETPSTLAGLARMVNRHPVYVARAFRARFGCSVGEYVRRTRIAQACARLADSEATLAEISTGAGFYDQSHFSRVFRANTGMSPGEYRRAVRAGSAGAGGVPGVLDGMGARRHPGRGGTRA